MKSIRVIAIGLLSLAAIGSFQTFTQKPLKQAKTESLGAFPTPGCPMENCPTGIAKQ